MFIRKMMYFSCKNYCRRNYLQSKQDEVYVVRWIGSQKRMWPSNKPSKDERDEQRSWEAIFKAFLQLASVFCCVVISPASSLLVCLTWRSWIHWTTSSQYVSFISLLLKLRRFSPFCEMSCIENKLKTSWK